MSITIQNPSQWGNKKELRELLSSYLLAGLTVSNLHEVLYALREETPTIKQLEWQQETFTTHTAYGALTPVKYPRPRGSGRNG